MKIGLQKVKDEIEKDKAGNRWIERLTCSGRCICKDLKEKEPALG